ncbi:hypothetical protein F0562_031218 [Nyssa sinensis]|uniref:Uncharacterized protein n=1 Tax=Nyssa sinensis TaxID=561372 RepID=A0A5J5AXL5_9ASTE|nr:hypothetical protein F0562_031218 [Nyssa sinensis]
MANTMARSFLQVAATEEVASPLRVVQIEGLFTCLEEWCMAASTPAISAATEKKVWLILAWIRHCRRVPT